MMARVVGPQNKIVNPGPDERKLERLVEEICQLGCDAVNGIISQIGQGQVPKVAHQLNAQQLQQLQAELEEVMAPLKH